MEQQDISFLTTIAQVSATLIGFCLLIPLFERFKKGTSSLGEKLIVRKIRYTRSMEVLFLPVTMTCSLLLIQGYDLLRYFQGLSMSQCFYFLYFYKVQRDSRISAPKHIRVFLEVAPYVLMVSSIILSATPFLYEEYFYYGMLLTVVGGFLVFSRNLLVTYEDGLTFRLCEVNKQLLEKLENFLNEKIPKALDNRRKIVEKLRLVCNKEKDDKRLREIKLSIAKQEVEIQRWQEHRRDLRKRFKKIFNDNDNKRITLGSSIDFYEWIKEHKEHLLKFEEESLVIERQIEQIYGLETK